jgi:ectoine hydroxylase-related dioxygenase (phytanoyl-CoA dioxygenase family)
MMIAVCPVKIPKQGSSERKHGFVYGMQENFDAHDQYPARQLACKAGDVIVFDLRLVHASGINSSGGVRWSAQARYHDAKHEEFLVKKYSL